jgi:iron complex transport system substrate-binding protein
MNIDRRTLLTGLSATLVLPRLARAATVTDATGRARNVAAERRGGMATVSVEQVLAWNPDVIITIEPAFAASVRTDPVWAPVKAVQTGRIHLSPRLPFGWVGFPPSVNRLIGLWWLAKVLYPDQFPEDLRPLTRDFYRQFYHMTPTDAQIDAVLAGSP